MRVDASFEELEKAALQPSIRYVMPETRALDVLRPVYNTISILLNCKVSLGEDPIDHIAADIGQARAPPHMPVSLEFVVESQRVQHRCLQVVDMNWILRDPQPQFVGFPDYLSASNASIRYPTTEALCVRVSSRGIVDPLQFARRRPPELAYPDHRRRVELPPLLELFEQSSCGLVCDAAILSQFLVDLLMIVPTRFGYYRI